MNNRMNCNVMDPFGVCTFHQGYASNEESVARSKGILYFALEADVGKLDRIGILQTLIKTMIAGTLAGAFAFWGSHFWHPERKLTEFASLIVLGLLSVWVYYFATKLLGMHEAAYFDRAMNRLQRRGPAPVQPSGDNAIVEEEPMVSESDQTERP